MKLDECEKLEKQWEQMQNLFWQEAEVIPATNLRATVAFKNALPLADLVDLYYCHIQEVSGVWPKLGFESIFSVEGIEIVVFTPGHEVWTGFRLAIEPGGVLEEFEREFGR